MVTYSTIRSQGYSAVRNAIVSAVDSDVTVVSTFTPEQVDFPIVVLPMLNPDRVSVTTGSTSVTQSMVTLPIEVFVTNKAGQGSTKLANIIDDIESALIDGVDDFFYEGSRSLSVERFDLNSQTIITSGIEIDFGLKGDN